MDVMFISPHMLFFLQYFILHFFCVVYLNNDYSGYLLCGYPRAIVLEQYPGCIECQWKSIANLEALQLSACMCVRAYACFVRVYECVCALVCACACVNSIQKRYVLEILMLIYNVVLKIYKCNDCDMLRYILTNTVTLLTQLLH